MYTLEKCEQLWEESGQHGTPQQRIDRAKLWEPYYSLMASPFLLGSPDREIQEHPFVNYLAAEGILNADTTVLDIGAGMGGYTLPLGKLCRRVTALEPVGCCLEVLERRSKACGLDNIQTVHDFWETFQTDIPFDVTLSAMCPAICNAAELRRMENMTRKTCCLVAVQRGSYDKHRKAMMAQLEIKPQGGMTTEAIHYINALYLMGRQPNVKFLESRIPYKTPVPQIMEQYPVYFRIFGIPEYQSIPFLERYLAEYAKDGFLEDESYLRQALIYWNVH